jgi:Protein of unknown function (DUF2585)
MTHPSNGKTVDDSNRAPLVIDRRTAFAVLGLICVFLGLLYLEGRPAWCESGLAFWSPAWNSCTSQNLFDPYSLSHVLHGVIFFWLLRPLAGRVPLAWRLIAAIGFEVGWEVLENSPWIIARYRQDTAAFDYTGDSILNSLGDVLSTVVGFVYASRYSWKASVALFVVFELWMLWLAHDNLTLNVLMLLHPIEAVKEWQLSAVTGSG